MASHRVLTLSFEFHVPEGLRCNIRAARLESAVSAITAAVQSLAATHFPWANNLVVRSQWAYRWSDSDTTVRLAPTDQNTVVESPDNDPTVTPDFTVPQP